MTLAWGYAMVRHKLALVCSVFFQELFCFVEVIL